MEKRATSMSVYLFGVALGVALAAAGSALFVVAGDTVTIVVALALLVSGGVMAGVSIAQAELKHKKS